MAESDQLMNDLDGIVAVCQMMANYTDNQAQVCKSVVKDKARALLDNATLKSFLPDDGDVYKFVSARDRHKSDFEQACKEWDDIEGVYAILRKAEKERHCPPKKTYPNLNKFFGSDIVPDIECKEVALPSGKGQTSNMKRILDVFVVSGYEEKKEIIKVLKDFNKPRTLSDIFKSKEVVLKANDTQNILNILGIDATTLTNAVSTIVSSQQGFYTECMQLLKIQEKCTSVVAALQKSTAEEAKSAAEELSKALRDIEKLLATDDAPSYLRAISALRNASVVARDLRRGSAVKKDSDSGGFREQKQGDWASPDMPRIGGETRPDPTRMRACVGLVTEFKKSLGDLPLTKRIESTRLTAQQALDRIAADVKAGACEAADGRPRMLSVLRAYASNVVRLINNFTSEHSRFNSTNRNARSYMTTWSQFPREKLAELAGQNTDETFEEEELINKYFEVLQEIASAAKTTMTLAGNEAADVFSGGREEASAASILEQDEYMSNQAQIVIDAIERAALKAGGKIHSMYLRGSPSYIEVITDPTFMIIYILKTVRVLMLYFATLISRTIFLPYYQNTVYTQNTNPPSLALLLLIFIGVDFGLNLVVGIALFLTKHVFETRANNFPVNQELIRLYYIDYACCTVLMTIMGFAFANVIQRKQYFRYRFEGDRAIRAFGSINLWVASVIVYIPFFRLFM